MADSLRSQGPSASPLEIHLFGGFQLLHRGEALPPVPSRQARLLFAYLAMNPSRPQPRGPLAARFWPDLPEARARRRLSHTIWQVTDVLGEGVPGRNYLDTDSEAVQFDGTQPYWFDVEEFENALDVVDASRRDSAEIGQQLRFAVDLYHGEFLEGHYEDWVTAEQERLAHRYTTALGRLARFCERQGNFDQALTYAKRITHEAPLREDAHRDVMRLQVLLNRPSQALQQFERVRSVLAEELGAEPAAETIELFERVARTRRVASAPAALDEPDLSGRRLVGRRQERQRLLARLDRALQGRSCMVFVEGEPGVGKSRLLAQVADDAGWRGLTVLWGSCPSEGRGQPYHALREALAPELHAVRVAQLAPHVQPVWRNAAAQLFPGLATRSGTATHPQLDGAPAGARLRHAVVQVLAGLARLSPTLLVIEDAHWADPDSLELLRELAAAGHDVPLMVVLSFRDLEAREASDVWETLREVDRTAQPERVRLQGLTAFETAELVGETLGSVSPPVDFVNAIHRESGGNPLYALELLRTIRDVRGLAVRGDDGLSAGLVPAAADLDEVVAARLGRLGEAERDVLDVAAILGDEFSLELLAACTDGAGSDGPALGRLLRHNVLEHDGEVARFTHAVTRRVVVEALPDERAQRLHAVAANALQRHDSDDVEALAEHLIGAGEVQRAIPVLRRAADRALRVHAYATAAGHLARARKLASTSLVDVDDLFELLVVSEHVLAVIGRQDERADVLDELSLLASGDIDLQLQVLRLQALMLSDAGDLDGAEAAARRGVELADGRASERARLLGVLGLVLSHAGRNLDAVAVLDEALAVAVDEPTRAETLVALGTAHRFLQHFEQAQQSLQAAHELARDVEDLTLQVRALGALADVAAEAGDLDEALATYDRTLASAREIGYRHREGVALVNLANLEQLHGRPASAAVHYDQADRVFAELGNQRGRAMVQLNRAWLRHRWLGEDAAAADDARAASEYFASVGNRAAAALCAQTLAAIGTRAGRFAEANATLQRALVAVNVAGEHRAEVQVLRGLAETALAAGDLAAAAEFGRTALALAQDVGISEFVADLAALVAVVHARGGRNDLAADVAARAHEVIDGATERHLVHHRLAEVARAAGAEERASHHDCTAGELLSVALADLAPSQHRRALETVAELAAIDRAWRAAAPREVDVRLTRQGVPTGRALRRDDTVVVHLVVPPVNDRDQRCEALVTVLDQVRRQQALATVRDLADVLDVSTSTIRRDLKRLRDAGIDVVTRGTA